jgi:hypothetical protein
MDCRLSDSLVTDTIDTDTIDVDNCGLDTACAAREEQRLGFGLGP